jgi:GGDEF domain-containing protein
MGILGEIAMCTKLGFSGNSELIELLGVDKFYGIYTRNYLEYVFAKNYKDIDYYTLIVDFDGVGDMNKKLGYIGTNHLFKTMFQNFASNNLQITIGRWFSGDEIALISLDNNMDKLVCDFANHCRPYGLKFKVLVSTNKKIKNISDYYHEFGSFCHG